MGVKKECELCGRETNSLFRREIEGVLMYVCSDCKEYGEEPQVDRQMRAKQVRRSRNSEKFHGMYGSKTNSSTGTTPSRSTMSSSSRSLSHSRKRKPRIANLKVIDNAAEILRKCRTKLGFSSKDFAQSVLIKENYYKRIEKQTTPLPIDIARKFEKKYHIDLIKEEEEDGADREILSRFMAKDSKSSESVIYFKKRGQKPEYDQ
ncbi:MAG: helix-turn-helix domain-containing protein [Promethearchaeota archaeon]